VHPRQGRNEHHGECRDDQEQDENSVPELRGPAVAAHPLYPTAERNIPSAAMAMTPKKMITMNPYTVFS
jgi:hypothetical protein